MNGEFYRKLVDLYAGRELPQELEDEMDWAAFGDPELTYEMSTLRRTVELLREIPEPEFTREIDQNIQTLLCARGVALEPAAPPTDCVPDGISRAATESRHHAPASTAARGKSDRKAPHSVASNSRLHRAAATMHSGQLPDV